MANYCGAGRRSVADERDFREHGRPGLPGFPLRIFATWRLCVKKRAHAKTPSRKEQPQGQGAQQSNRTIALHSHVGLAPLIKGILSGQVHCMDVSPITLEGRHVRLEPLTPAHADALIAAAGNGELWNTQVTIIPKPGGMNDYIRFALDGLAQGNQLPFVIVRKDSSASVPLASSGSANAGSAGAPPANAATANRAVARPLGRAQEDSDLIVGSTRFYEIFPNDRKCAVGYTWLSKSAQRTPINTECKLLLFTHAFETWKCVRVELITDVLNEQSRAAILRLGAKQEGILRKHLILPSGRVRDSVFFSITDEEWPEVKQKLISKLAGATTNRK